MLSTDAVTRALFVTVSCFSSITRTAPFYALPGFSTDRFALGEYHLEFVLGIYVTLRKCDRLLCIFTVEKSLSPLWKISKRWASPPRMKTVSFHGRSRFIKPAATIARDPF
jgi:hypothetical protein